MRKKIIHISQSNGGVARYLQMLFKYTKMNKYEQILVYSKEYYNEKKDFENLVDHIEFVDMSRNINLIKDFKAIVKICKIIKKYNPDLVYVHSSKAGALGRIANIITRKKIIYNPHGWAFSMNVSEKKRKLYKLIEKTLAIITDEIIAISNSEKTIAIENKICNEKKIKVIVNGIDLNEYYNSRIRRKKEIDNIPEDKVIIGMVGRISEQKGPDTFVKVAYEIFKTIPNTFFIIVGDGEDKQKILKLIKQYKMEENFLITGWVDNVYDYIEKFNIAMLLTRWEGFGFAIAEYMVSERPIVATNIGAVSELIENYETGILVEADNINNIVGETLKVINDINLQKKMVYNAKVRVKKEYDVARVAEESANLIDNMIS